MRKLPILATLLLVAGMLAACSTPTTHVVAGTYRIDAEITATNDPARSVGDPDFDTVTVSEARFGVTMTFDRSETTVYGTRDGNQVRLFREGTESKIWYELTWTSDDTFEGTLHREDPGDVYVDADLTGVATTGTASESLGAAGFLDPILE